MEGFGWYTYEVTKRMVENHPEHEFIFFFDRKYDEKFIFGSNVTPVVLNPPARHPFLFLIWFEIALRKALKKHKIDVFFSPDGYLSLGSKVPQVGVIHDINFEHYPEDIPFTPRTYLKYFFPRFARKATKIITVSEYSKQDICATYSIPQEKVTVAWNGASEAFKPISDTEKIELKEKLTQGKPFFLFVGALHPRKNVKRLIEAYINYVSSSETEYQLVIVGTALWGKIDLAIPEEIHSRIHFTGHLSLAELSKIMAAADVFTYVPYFEGFGIPLVEAMKCGTPILSGNKTSLPEIAGDAAIYCDPFDIEDISEKLKLIAEDESLREVLREKGLERSKIFSWNSTAEKVWEQIVLTYEESSLKRN